MRHCNSEISQVLSFTLHLAGRQVCIPHYPRIQSPALCNLILCIVQDGLRIVALVPTLGTMEVQDLLIQAEAYPIRVLYVIRPVHQSEPELIPTIPCAGNLGYLLHPVFTLYYKHLAQEPLWLLSHLNQVGLAPP